MRQRLRLAMAVAAAWQLTCAAGTSTLPNPEEERARLDAERSGIEQQHANARAKCYQHFEVNQCLANARRRQRDALNEVRRQERILNADERQRKAIAQVQKLEDRNSLASQEAAATDLARRQNEQIDRQERSANKMPGKPQAAPRDKANEKTTVSGVRGGAASKSAPVTKSTDADKNLATFNQKQQDAAEHRADLDKRRRERTSPLAAPLPAVP